MLNVNAEAAWISFGFGGLMGLMAIVLPFCWASLWRQSGGGFALAFNLFLGALYLSIGHLALKAGEVSALDWLSVNFYNIEKLLDGYGAYITRPESGQIMLFFFTIAGVLWVIEMVGLLWYRFRRSYCKRLGLVA